MEIEARSKDKRLAVNEDILTKIKMELKGVWKVYIRNFGLISGLSPKCQTQRKYLNST